MQNRAASIGGFVTLTTLVVAFFLLTGTAVADRASGRDPTDSQGRLDVAAVGHGHRDGRLAHRVKMHDPWKSNLLSGKRKWIALWISTNDTADSPEGFERLIWIHYSHDRLTAGIYRQKADESGFHIRYRLIRKIPVHRPNRRTARVTFNPNLLGRDVSKYRWFAQTGWQVRKGPCSSNDGQTVDDPAPFEEAECTDRGPNHRDLHHQL